MIKSIKVDTDSYTDLVSKAFDYKFNGVSLFNGWDKLNIPTDFNIGVIVGASGTGKSTLLSEFGIEEVPIWHESKGIVSHFKSPKEAIDKLTAVGLNSIPSWVRPYHVL